MDNDIIQLVAIAIIPVIFAITVHEVAHGWVASQLGDQTARMMGRLTLNPLKHIDPVGTVLVPGVLLALGGFLFGWARPVPVSWQNLHRPRRDMALVAVAGPAANLLMAVFWVMIMKLTFVLMPDSIFTYPLFRMADLGVKINIVLMLLNLLPILPLDGGRIMHSMLPPHLARQFAVTERWGIFIVMGVFIALQLSGQLASIVLPPINLITTVLYGIFGL